LHIVKIVSFLQSMCLPDLPEVGFLSFIMDVPTTRKCSHGTCPKPIRPSRKLYKSEEKIVEDQSISDFAGCSWRLLARITDALGYGLSDL